jgi:hypothetical protein
MERLDKSAIQAIADNLAAETMARAALLRAQARRKGIALEHIEAVNAAILAMLCERKGTLDG